MPSHLWNLRHLMALWKNIKSRPNDRDSVLQEKDIFAHSRSWVRSLFSWSRAVLSNQDHYSSCITFTFYAVKNNFLSHRMINLSLTKSAYIW